MSSDPAAKPPKYYLTTPIYYVNARPHIGHAYTTIVADVLARRHRLLGEDTFFLTGTDEHGQKIERSAAAKGMPPQQFADEVAASFEGLWKRMGITNDRFIRTTSESHKRGVQKLFTTLYERGFIYLDSYTGAYCVSDEAFVDVPVGTSCPDCGRLTESVTEENFFFRLSAFQRPLLDLIESGTLKVEPETRRNEVLSFLRGSELPLVDEFLKVEANGRSEDEIGIDEVISWGERTGRVGRSLSTWIYFSGALKDLSISRSSFTWGVPVPESAIRAAGAKDKHVIYVWLDALANYMTAVGYGGESDPTLSEKDRAKAKAEFSKWWPADLHLVGKEIIRFHCVYWPAFLLALNPELQQVAPRAELQQDAAADNPTPAVILREAKDLRISPGAPLQLNPDPATLSPIIHKAWAAQMLPKAITAHGWLLFDNSKMSKSKGNIVRTETILEAFGSLCPSLPVTPSDSSPLSTPLSFRSEAEESTSLPAEPQLRPPTAHERDLFASDVLRYFLLREIPFGQDGSFSFEAMVTRYNADLANGYGNLVSRTLNLITKDFDALVPGHQPFEQRSFVLGDGKFHLERPRNLVTIFGPELAQRASALCAIYDWAFNDLVFTSPVDGLSGEVTRGGVVDSAQHLIAATDVFLTAKAPWKLVKSLAENDRKETADVLYTAAESIRIITALLYPILPFATARVWAQLGLGDIEAAAANGELNNLQWGGLKPGTRLGPLSPIFPRADKSLIQIMTDMENEKPSTPASSDTRAAAPLKAALTPAPAAPVATSTTDPAAPPRAFRPLDEPAGVLPVAGSLAEKPTLPSTPGPATEAPASGVFGGSASQAPIDAQPEDASPQITIDDFAKVELRVAQVVVCERIPKADKLLRLEVDLGYEKRQILSGIAEWYAPEDLLGRRIVVITNLAPRKMRGLESHGMLLAASNGPDNEGKPGKPVLATFGEDIALGSRLK